MKSGSLLIGCGRGILKDEIKKIDILTDFLTVISNVSPSAEPEEVEIQLFSAEPNTEQTFLHHILGASEVRANLYCNSRTSALGRLHDYLRFHMKR